jgi:hypothetical protein
MRRLFCGGSLFDLCFSIILTGQRRIINVEQGKTEDIRVETSFGTDMAQARRVLIRAFALCAPASKNKRAADRIA